MFDERIQNLTHAQRESLAQAIRARSSKANSLVAWYTTETGEEVSQSALRESVSTRLPAAVIPRQFILVDEMPRTSTGKLDRRRLVEKIKPAESHIHPTASGESPTEKKLRAIWTQVLALPQFDSSENFFELGGDSLSLIKLIALANDEGIQITPSLFHENPTLRLLSTAIENPRGREPTPLQIERAQETQPIQAPAASETRDASSASRLICLSESRVHSPLFFLPPKGVAISEFRHVASHLNEFTCYSPVTLERNSADVLTVADLAARFLDEIQSVQPAGPYRLIGTCEGAYVAWEMTQQLTSQGQRVEFLGIIDTPNPRAMVYRPLSERLKLRLETLRGLSPWNASIQVVRRAASWLKRRTKQTIVKEVHLTRAGSRMGWQFTPSSLDGRATLFRAARRLEDTDFDADFTNGWGGLLGQGLDVYSLPCDRLQMLQPPFAEQLAGQIDAAIRYNQSLPATLAGSDS